MNLNKITKIANEILMDAPTQEMIDWFNTRTNKHITLVKKYCNKINLDCEGHDQSKFLAPEFIPYVFITWQYKCKDTGKEFKVSDTMKKLMNEVTEHHVKTNKHHAEYWSDETNVISLENRDKAAKCIDCTKMPLEYVAEMTADWCAVSEERGNSPKDWADQNIGIRWEFNDRQKQLIYNIISNVF